MIQPIKDIFTNWRNVQHRNIEIPMQKAVFYFAPGAIDAYVDNITISGHGKYVYVLDGLLHTVDLDYNFDGTIDVPAIDPGSVLTVYGEAITRLSCGDVDLSELTSLTYLFIQDAERVVLDLTHCTDLTWLRYENNAELVTVDLSGLTKLSYVYFRKCFKVESISFNAIEEAPATAIANLITAADSTTGEVYLNNSDPYYSTVADAATAKGWVIKPLD